MKMFPPHMTDFYKTGHIRQYPEGTTKVYSNFTCRSDKWAATLPGYDHKVVFFGLQGVVQWLLIDLWNEEFFARPKDEVVARYQRRMDRSLGPGAVSSEHIAALHDLGYLPLVVKALPEGSRVDIRVPLFTVCNTLDEFYWVTNYVETQLSAECWKMITSATTAHEYRRLFEHWALETGVDLAFVDFQGHDFSARGMSGFADATQSGAAHLTSFKGTDTITVIDWLEDYYATGRHDVDGLIGASVPATEHSVMCMGGEDDELATFQRLITEVYPSGIVSIVSDSWDYWQVITQYAKMLRGLILKRDGKVVFRPDSGDPVKIVAGYRTPDTSFDADKYTAFSEAKLDARLWHAYQDDAEAFQDEDGKWYALDLDEWPNGDPIPNRGRELTEAEVKGSVECLWEIFGGTVTSTGHKTLDGHVGLIYGDSISLERAQAILERLAAKGFSSANIVFGIGSYTYQYVTRDTFGTAMKATWGVVNGVEREICKNPKTDSGVKKSAKGLLRVEREGGKFVLYDQQTTVQEAQGVLQAVFLNGDLMRFESLADVRARLRAS